MRVPWVAGGRRAVLPQAKRVWFAGKRKMLSISAARTDDGTLAAIETRIGKPWLDTEVFSALSSAVVAVKTG